MLRAQFYQAVKLVSHIRNERERRQREGEARGQEKSFLKNFWAFSKKAVNSLVGKVGEKPSFDKAFADEWFRDRYSIPIPLAPEAVNWFPRLSEGAIDFDMGPIRPRDVKAILSKKKATSSPEDDGIFFGHLRHLESTNHSLPPSLLRRSFPSLPLGRVKDPLLLF